MSDFFRGDSVDLDHDPMSQKRHSTDGGIMRAKSATFIEPTSVGFAPTPMRGLNLTAPKADPSARRLVRQPTVSIRRGSEAMTMTDAEFDRYEERSTPVARGGGGPPRSPVGGQASQYSQGGNNFNGLKVSSNQGVSGWG